LSEIKLDCACKISLFLCHVPYKIIFVDANLRNYSAFVKNFFYFSFIIFFLLFEKWFVIFVTNIFNSCKNKNNILPTAENQDADKRQI